MGELTAIDIHQATAGGKVAFEKVLQAILSQSLAGSAPVNTLPLTVNPTAGDKFSIGADTFEYQATGGDLSDDTYIGIEIGTDAAASFANTLAAVNARTVGNQHPNLKRTDSTTPALANGTQDVLGVDPGSSLLVLLEAESPGGEVKFLDTPSDIATIATLTSTATWTYANMNAFAGRAESTRKMTLLKFDVSTTLITAGGAALWVPFEPSYLIPIPTNGGSLTTMGADTVVASGHLVSLTLNGGGPPDLVDGDTLFVLAFE